MSISEKLRSGQDLRPSEAVVCLTMLGGFPEAAAELGLGVPLTTVAAAIGKSLGSSVNPDMVALLSRGVVSAMPGDGTMASEIAGVAATFISSVDDEDDGLGLATGVIRRAKVAGAYSAINQASRELVAASPDFDDADELAIRLMVGLLATPVIYTVEGDLLSITTALPTALLDAANALIGIGDDTADPTVSGEDVIGLIKLLG
jgi:hypothetical protein